MHQNTSQALSHIKLNLERISKLDVPYLAGNAEWPFSFAIRERQINQIIKDCKIILGEFNEDTAFLLDKPVGYLNSLSSHLEGMWDSLRNIRNFVDTNKNKTKGHLTELFDTHKKLVDDFDQQHKLFVMDYTPVVSIVTSNIVSRNNELKEENIDLTVGTENDIAELYSDIFSTRKASHEDAAEAWLMGIAALVTVSVGYTLYLTYTFEPCMFNNYIDFLDHVALRVILFSLAGYALHFMSRAYSFNKRQQIYNHDRDAALQCFPRFMRTSIKDDPELHRAIMTQITQSIFESRDNFHSDESSKEKIISAPNLTVGLMKKEN